MAHDFMALCNSHWPSVLYFLSWFISCEGRVSTVNDTAKSKECNISVLSHAMNCSSLFLNPVSFLSYIVSKNRTGTIVIQRKKNQRQNKEKEVTQHTIHFLNPNIFFPIWILIVLIYEKPPGKSEKIILLPNILLTFHCLNRLF